MMGVSNDPGTWVMAFIMLSLFSFLWKESPFSKIAEAIYAGAAAGYMLALSYKNVKDMAIHPLTQGKSTLIVPIVLGLLLYCSLSKKYSHLSRYGTAIPIGIGTGLALRALLSAQILSQIQATVLPVNSLSNIFQLLGWSQQATCLPLAEQGGKDSANSRPHDGCWPNLCAAFSLILPSILAPCNKGLLGLMTFKCVGDLPVGFDLGLWWTVY